MSVKVPRKVEEAQVENIRTYMHAETMGNNQLPRYHMVLRELRVRVVVPSGVVGSLTSSLSGSRKRWFWGEKERETCFLLVANGENKYPKINNGKGEWIMLMYV